MHKVIRTGSVATGQGINYKTCETTLIRKWIPGPVATAPGSDMTMIDSVENDRQRTFKVARAAIVIVAGHTSKLKTVSVTGVRRTDFQSGFVRGRTRLQSAL